MKTLTLTILATLSTGALADNSHKFPDDFVYEPFGMYFGMNYAKFNFDIKGHDDLTTEPPLKDLEPEMIIARLGYSFNKFFAVEGRLGADFAEDGYNFTFPELPVGHPDNPTENPIAARNSATSVSLNNMQAVMLTATLPVHHNLHFYATGGYSNFKIDFRADREQDNSFSGTQWSENKSGGSYGVGVDYNFTEHVSVNVEYMSYLTDDEFDLKAGSVGLLVNF